MLGRASSKCGKPGRGDVAEQRLPCSGMAAMATVTNAIGHPWRAGATPVPGEHVNDESECHPRQWHIQRQGCQYPRGSTSGKGSARGWKSIQYSGQCAGHPGPEFGAPGSDNAHLGQVLKHRVKIQIYVLWATDQNSIVYCVT